MKMYSPNDCIRSLDRCPGHHHFTADLIVSKFECSFEWNKHSIFDCGW